MKIEVLGTGCAKCTQLYDNVKKALELAARKPKWSRCRTSPRS